MAAYMTGIELAPERRKGVGVVDRRVFLPQNGVFPTDLAVMTRVMPIPYNLTMDLYVYSSNTDQSLQISEQLLIMFDPMIQIQKNDKQADWTKLTQVELISINNEETVPIGAEKRAIIWSYQFTIPIWLTPPVAVRENVITNIVHRMTTGELEDLTEINEDDEIVQFSSKY